MEFYLSNETIERSKFKSVKVGDHINLELPLKYGNKLSGHMTQGHVDCSSCKLCLPLKKLINHIYLSLI